MATGLSPVVAWWLRIPADGRGALWLTIGALGWALTDTMVKLLGRDIHPVELTAARYWVGLVAMAPLLLRAGWGKIRTRRPVPHAVRAVLGAIAQVCLFYAVIHLPLADATAIGFSRPLFMTLLAAIILHETVGWRLWSATLIGFAGVLVMVRPGEGAGELAALVAVLGALIFALVSMMIARLAKTDTPLQILFYYFLVGALTSSVATAWVWTTPAWNQIPIMIAMGLLSTFAMTCVVRGLSVGAVSVAAPMEYTRLIYAAAIGYMLFGEIPDGWTLAGAIVIVAAALYVGRSATQRPRGGG